MSTGLEDRPEWHGPFGKGTLVQAVMVDSLNWCVGSYRQVALGLRTGGPLEADGAISPPQSQSWCLLVLSPSSQSGTGCSTAQGLCVARNHCPVRWGMGSVLQHCPRSS
jgi:hypothetical protein